MLEKETVDRGSTSGKFPVDRHSPSAQEAALLKFNRHVHTGRKSTLLRLGLPTGEAVELIQSHVFPLDIPDLGPFP